jgi:hypothetical protein
MLTTWSVANVGSDASTTVIFGGPTMSLNRPASMAMKPVTVSFCGE